MDGHPGVGVATCALKNEDGSFQGTGGHFPNLFRIFSWMFFIDSIPLIDRAVKPFHPMHPKSFFYKGMHWFTNKQKKDWVSGAFFLTRRALFNEVGGFDEKYFMYTEEVDLCWRIVDKGFSVWYLPKWSIIHLGGASSSCEFPIISEYKGVKTFYSKFMPSWQYPVLRLLLKGGALLRIILYGILKDKDAVKTYVKALKVA
jgi:GT2 family glycosyltransferase